MFEGGIFPRIVPVGGGGGSQIVPSAILLNDTVPNAAGQNTLNITRQFAEKEIQTQNTDAYSTGTDLNNPYSITWGTKRVIELQTINYTNFGTIQFLIIDPSFSTLAGFAWSAANNYWQINVNSTYVNNAGSSVLDRLALAITSNGDIELYINGNLIHTENGLFDGLNFVFALQSNNNNDTLNSGDNFSVQFITAGSEMVNDYGQANDFYGLAIS